MLRRIQQLKHTLIMIENKSLFSQQHFTVIKDWRKILQSTIYKYRCLQTQTLKSGSYPYKSNNLPSFALRPPRLLFSTPSNPIAILCHRKYTNGNTYKKGGYFAAMVVGGFLISGLGAIFMFYYFPPARPHVFNNQIKFKADVFGVDDALKQLEDITIYLKNPRKYSKIGGKLPKGILLVGPQGVGKTFLAQAVANEANVPFYFMHAYDFDDSPFFDQGTRTLRHLFLHAKYNAPCIIFIDEIDLLSDSACRELLRQFDDLTDHEHHVVVLAATTDRGDVASALLRSYRFSMQVDVNLPDSNGRQRILEYYLSKVIHDKNISAELIARRTGEMSCAELKKLVNQAALRAAIEGAPCVSMTHLENARDSILMGPEKPIYSMSEEDAKITAVHEAGHAIVSLFTENSQPLHKITIVRRGDVLGFTSCLSSESVHVTKAQMTAEMDMLMGGRAAEEIIFGSEKITSSASDDLKEATNLAEYMVKVYGMSESVGVGTYDPTLGVNEEIKRQLDDSLKRAKAIIKAHSKEVQLIADELIKKRTLSASDVETLLNNNKKT